MSLTTTTRLLAATLLLCAAAASAQRGPGGGGPPSGGGPPGGGPPGAGGIFGGPPRGPEMDRGNNRDIQPQQPRRTLQLAPPGRWWDEKRAVKHLSLSSAQQQKMDEIFEANKPKLQALLTNLQNEEAHLANLTPAERQDESRVFAAIDRVTQAHGELEKADAHIELQIRQQLDPKQLAQLDKDLANARPD